MKSQPSTTAPIRWRGWLIQRSSPASDMNKSRVVRIALYAALIFLAGGITGALVAPMIGRSFMRLPDSHQMSHMMLARPAVGP